MWAVTLLDGINDGRGRCLRALRSTGRWAFHAATGVRPRLSLLDYNPIRPAVIRSPRLAAHAGHFSRRAGRRARPGLAPGGTPAGADAFAAALAGSSPNSAIGAQRHARPQRRDGLTLQSRVRIEPKRFREAYPRPALYNAASHAPPVHD